MFRGKFHSSKKNFRKGKTTKEKMYLDHLNISGLFEQAGEAGAVDVEGEVTHKEFEIRGETGLTLIAQDILVLLVVGRNGNVSDEPRRQGQKPSGRRRK